MLKISILFPGVTKSPVQNPCPSGASGKRLQKVQGWGNTEECLGVEGIGARFERSGSST